MFALTSGAGKSSRSSGGNSQCSVQKLESRPAVLPVSLQTDSSRAGAHHSDASRAAGALGCDYGNIQCQCPLHQLPHALPRPYPLWQVGVKMKITGFVKFF